MKIWSTPLINIGKPRVQKDATDPLAFVRWHYDKKHNGIYAIDEFYGQKISNRQAANWIKSRGYQSDRIGADSA